MPPNFLLNQNAALVLDTSVLININASSFALEILNALPNRILISNEVVLELEKGKKRGYKDADLLNEFVQIGLIGIVVLNESELNVFEQLVIGPAGATLDDGESATVAYAVENKAIAIIDECKAHRICKERFPSLKVGCTMDLFTHPSVQESLGKERLSTAVTNALKTARMRVLPDHMNLVTDLIGKKNAGLCQSLPRAIRSL